VQRDFSKVEHPSLASPFADKRHSWRRSSDCFVVVRFRFKRIVAVCIDWTDNGLGAVVEERLPVGETVVIEFPLAGDVPLKLEGRVVYQNDAIHGFEFGTPDGKTKRLIGDFFRENTERKSNLYSSPKRPPRVTLL